MTTLRGYATVWRRSYNGGAGYDVRINPRAAAPVSDGADLLFRHDQLLIPRSANLIQFHADDYGLAVSVELPWGKTGEQIYDAVRSGRVRALSIGESEPGWKSEMREENGRDVAIFSEWRFAEFSLTPAGANPRALCWIEGTPDHQLSDEQRIARGHFRIGARMEQRRDDAANAAKARAARVVPPRTVVPASVTQIIRMLEAPIESPIRPMPPGVYEAYEAAQRRRLHGASNSGNRIIGLPHSIMGI